MMKKLIAFFKKETVLSIAAVLAVISMFFVHPDGAYVSYVDFRTLGILFCLMCVMAGLQRIQLFKKIAQMMLKHVHSVVQLVLILVMLCFFFSMLITNDVALITFVPLTLTVIEMLKMKDKKQWIIPVVVLQTIAANLGSMLTPIGNPQNLYLYGQSGMSTMDFILLMLPYTALAFVMLCIFCVGVTFRKNEKISITLEGHVQISSYKLLIVYIVLFVLSLLVVVHILPWQTALAAVLLAVVLIDRNTLKRVDYALLLTFIAFFVFIGNMGRIPVFKMFLQEMITGRETLTAIISSQVISNVPAALLLSGFTDNIEALIIGTNIGGLGTLIASMASLISFKAIARYDGKLKGKYFRTFTIWNIIFLVGTVLFTTRMCTLAP